MSKGLWPAVSGSIAQSQRLDTVANNLANSDTNGFKRDQVAFSTVISNAIDAANREEIPRKPYTDKDFHKLDGKDAAFVVVDATATDFSQGRVKITNGPLDVAIEGKGFIEVGTPQGVRYTRQGNLKLAADGTLVTTEGHPVLRRGAAAAQGEGGADLASRAIRLDPRQGAQLSISPNGNILQNGEAAGEISLVEFVELRELAKEGAALYRNDKAANVSTEAVKSTIHQGMLETSNVNAVAEMTEMLKATRLFEMSQKVVKTYGELEGRAVNDIGKF